VLARRKTNIGQNGNTCVNHTFNARHTQLQVIENPTAGERPSIVTTHPETAKRNVGDRIFENRTLNAAVLQVYVVVDGGTLSIHSIKKLLLLSL
jgi:hypothetical protein